MGIICVEEFSRKKMRFFFFSYFSKPKLFIEEMAISINCFDSLLFEQNADGYIVLLYYP